MSLIFEQCFSRKVKRLDSIQHPSVTLPQINPKAEHLRPMSPKKEVWFSTIVEEKSAESKAVNLTSDYHITPFSPKLKPRNIRAQIGEKIIRRISDDKESTKESIEQPHRRSIRIRSINESQIRRRILSQEAPKRSELNVEEKTPQKQEKKLYVQIKEKYSHDKVLNWNLK